MPFSNDLLNCLRQVNSHYDLADEHQLNAAAIRYADKLIDAGISVPKDILRYALLRTPIDLSKVQNFDPDLYIAAFVSDYQNNVWENIPEEKRTDFVYRLALEFNGPEIMKTLENPSEEFQLWAAIQFSEVLLYLPNPSIEIQRKAFISRPNLLQHFHKPIDKDVIDFVLKHRPEVGKYLSPSTPIEKFICCFPKTKKRNSVFTEEEIELLSKLDTYELCRLAIETNTATLAYINIPTLDLLKIALKKNPYSIYSMADLSDEAIELALQVDAGAIRFVEHLNQDWIEKFAQSKDPDKYWKIRCLPPEFQTDELCIRLINECKDQRDGEAYTMFGYVFNQSEDVCKAALKKDPRALMFIRNPQMYEKMNSYV